MRRFRKATKISVPADKLFYWHTRRGTFSRLSPPWQKVEQIKAPKTLEDGTKRILRLHWGPFSKRWVAVHKDVVPGKSFTDIQESGPFSQWEHRHRFLPDENGSILEDEVRYELPFMRWLGPHIGKEVKRLFRYRHRITQSDLATIERYREANRLTILVTGANGLLGSALVPFLRSCGHRVRTLVRSFEQQGPDKMPWNPETGEILQALLEGYDAVIHLCGAPIGKKLSDPLYCQKLKKSRIDSTNFLVETLRRLQHPPRTFLCASCFSYYGPKASGRCDESANAGQGFLANMCKEWEAAAANYSRGTTVRRTMSLRFGVLLGGGGGILPWLARRAWTGFLPILGSGEQMVSWISVDDAVYAIYHLLLEEGVQGPVNVSSPHAVTNRELITTLMKLYNRKVRWRLPERLLRIWWGATAEQTVLSDVEMQPAFLEKTKFEWHYPDLEKVLRLQLGRWS